MKKKKVGENTLRRINLSQYKKELAKVQSGAKENYKPKLGRLMKKLKNKITKLEK